MILTITTFIFLLLILMYFLDILSTDAFMPLILMTIFVGYGVLGLVVPISTTSEIVPATSIVVEEVGIATVYITNGSDISKEFTDYPTVHYLLNNPVDSVTLEIDYNSYGLKRSNTIATRIIIQ